LDKFDLIIKKQFNVEGFHLEHSTHYHIFCTMIIKDIYPFIENIKLKRLILKATAIIKYFILPNNQLINFGDSDLLDYKYLEKKKIYNYKNPSNFIKPFFKAGYFFAKNNGSYLALTSAFHSRVHKQCDDQSFIYFDNNELILTDSGKYGYIGKTKNDSELFKKGFWYSDPYRIYCESNRAHNTLEFDGKNFQRNKEKFYGSGVKNSNYYKSLNIITVETEIKIINSIKYNRLLILNPNKWLIVFDSFLDTKKLTHDVRQWFSFSPHLKLKQNTNLLTVSTKQPLIVSSLFKKQRMSKLYFGDKVPQLQGNYSSGYKKIQPTYSFCYELFNSDKDFFATLFNFSLDTICDTEYSCSNITGNQARFKWNDTSGTHYLKINKKTKAIEYIIK